MWKVTVFSFAFVILNVLALTDISDNRTFNKCCSRNESLIIIKENINTSDRYVCVNYEDLKNNYGINSVPLYISEKIIINEGFPIDCDVLQMVQIDSADANLMIHNNVCNDRLVGEIFNGTMKQNVPKTVAVRCNSTNVIEVDSVLQLQYIRKCCPNNQRYDMEFHQCREITVEDNDDLFEWDINLNDNNIYVLEYGLPCKYEEYAVELPANMYTLNINGSTLTTLSKDSRNGGQFIAGNWCVDRDYKEDKLLARVCTHDCDKFGAFCVRKCCPPGYHYKLFRCGTYKSYCTPNIDNDMFYNISSYLNPLSVESNNIFDVMGVGFDIQCPAGKYGLNKSIPQDQHRLTNRGQMWTPSVTTQHYCIEMFDRRDCPTKDVIVSGVLCFLPAKQVKNFQFSATVNTISSICLALTLIVYCALPELKNLHGRTLICHVSMMLLACACLARVQFNPIRDSNVMCTFLGYGIYFGFVAAFAWLNVMCFDIWWTFGSVRTVKPLRKSGSEKKRFLWYSLYAWGVTVALTTTMYVLDRYPVSYVLDANIGNGVCWFGTVQNTQSDWPHYIFFVIPMGIVTFTNFILWLLTARHCAKVKSEVHRLQAGSVGDRAKRRFRVDRAKYILTGKLWVVMGAGWVSELLSTVVSDPTWLWEIVDIFNEMQGVFIFLILVVKPKLYYLIKKRLGLSRAPIDPRLEKPDAQKNTTSSSGRTSSTFLSRTISSEEKAQLRMSLPNNIKRL